MPNQNQPNQNQGQQDSQVTPNLSTHADDLPPLPDFMSQPQEVKTPEAQTPEQPKMETSGSGAPPLPGFSDVNPSPKKKFGTGKIIATILGILLLVGGVGAGTYLTRQQQLIKQKATALECPYDCKGSSACTDGTFINEYFCTNSAEKCCKPNTSPTQCSFPNSCQSSCATGSTKVEGFCNSGVCCAPKPPDSQATCSQTCVYNHCPAGYVSISGSCSDGKVCCKKAPGCENCSANNCHCTGGDACTGYECVDDSFIKSCSDQGRSWCKNMNGVGMTCCVKGYVCNPNGDGCVQETNPKPSNSPAPTPTSAPSCSAISIYNVSWEKLTSTQLSSLTAGTSINLCLSGGVGVTFDKARFTVNGTDLGETTTKRSVSEDFCKSYVIPTGTTTFNISGQIHHPTLGWY